jgi:diguanylate cyclase (GGDEF)-like protein
MPEAKILIVDDARANLVALQVLLKPIEANIISAESGEQALQEVQDNEDHIALILLDVQMPVMDGFEVARLLHENEKTRSIPIIFITANQDDAHIEEAYLAGAVDYIQKPIRKTALLSKVNVFLDLWSLRFGLEQEIEQRRLAEHRVEHLATHDPLTNLPNRRGLYEELNELIYRSKRYRYSSAVIYVDLDGFKNVNDHFAHEAGDRLLAQVAANFKQIVRQTDSVARIGGDEFIVLITDIDRETTLITKIESLLKEASKSIEFNGHKISVSASIGIALYPEHGDNAETLLHHADQAIRPRITAKTLSASLPKISTRKRTASASCRTTCAGLCRMTNLPYFFNPSSTARAVVSSRWKRCCAGIALSSARSSPTNSSRPRKAQD